MGMVSKVSPVTGLKPTDLIGDRGIRDRILNDAELLAVWQAATAIGYPLGDIVKLLILTGQRLNEIARLKWDEVDLDFGVDHHQGRTDEVAEEAEGRRTTRGTVGTDGTVATQGDTTPAWPVRVQ